MRRTSTANNVPSIRTSTAGESSISMDSCLEDGFSANSFGSESCNRSEGRRNNFYRKPFSTSGNLRVDLQKEGGGAAGSFPRSLSGGVFLNGDSQSNRFPTTASRTCAPPAAPLEPSLRVMSVVVERSNISFCCYSEDQNEIMTETCTATGYETEALVERFLQVARPNMVLVG